jgi:hypothetical protein
VAVAVAVAFLIAKLEDEQAEHGVGNGIMREPGLPASRTVDQSRTE